MYGATFNVILCSILHALFFANAWLFLPSQFGCDILFGVERHFYLNTEADNMAHDVFISYSSKDKPLADGICANLEAVGIRCWTAPRDIGPGEDWPTAIWTRTRIKKHQSRM
jgi:hypothetical protein